MNDYLQHEIVLANAGPSTIETSRAYLQTAFSPLANAAWERESGYGWTMVSPEQMAGYVSAQVYALRYFSATTGQAQDHWGFAWAPRNASGASTSDFTSKTGLVLDRLGAADPRLRRDRRSRGSGKRGVWTAGQNVWCVGDLEGARLNAAWKSFRVWTQPALTFATPPQTIQAGTPSAAMTLSLVTSSGAPAVTPHTTHRDAGLELPAGHVLDEPDGPLVADAAPHDCRRLGHERPFYYLDTRAGSPVLSASAEDVTSGTQTETVIPGAGRIAGGHAGVRDGPRSSEPTRSRRRARDAYGNAFPVTAAWWLSPPAIGTLAPTRGTTTTFTASRTLGEAPSRPPSTPRPARSRARSQCG